MLESRPDIFAISSFTTVVRRTASILEMQPHHLEALLIIIYGLSLKLSSAVAFNLVESAGIILYSYFA